jgi:hypothetical protein
LKIDLKKSGGDFSSVNSFPPKLKKYLLDLSVLFVSTVALADVGDLQRYDSSQITYEKAPLLNRMSF